MRINLIKRTADSGQWGVNELCVNSSERKADKVSFKDDTLAGIS